ncbi:alpha/beta hydrolase [Hydrogenophaga laconesensis]|uniref:Acetyl esterase n=1 Tax=Hydrogenophaga laconesensis TaxID=1805971 RepID=A0ABU1V786_9BURK|nr:alpha/beta hydrolase [Hydrogenophaga laconesensis]MDR7093188.1 acetyl esterase [Hydrogenophaga laconesensis]
MSIDQPTLDLLDRVRMAGRKSFSACTAPEARAFPTLMKALFGEGEAVAQVRDVDIPTPQGHQVPARLYLPTQHDDRLIVFFHGGGWVLGSVADYGNFTATLAARTGTAVLSVDYRLAPESPFPGPVEDALAALDHAGQEGSQWLGQPLSRLIAMGDSAGATLATVATRRLRDTPGARQVDLQVLVYPVTDAGFDTPSYREFAQGHLLSADDMRWFWDHYCPDTAARRHPDASPLQATDLACLPPTRLFTAACDPLRDEGEAYGRRLKAAGVDCDVVRCEGLLHAFLSMIHYSPNAAQAFDTIVQSLVTDTAFHR